MRPGPIGTSCFTCKRRHKKCDQRQPICERCEAGDFECLGYGHIQSGPSVARVSRVARPVRRIAPKIIESEVLSVDPASSGGALANGSLLRREQSEDTDVTSSSSRSSTSASGKSAVATVTSMSTLRQLVHLYTQSQYSIPGSLNALGGPGLIDTIMARVEGLMAHWYFRPTDYQREHFRQDALRRLHRSKFTRWTAFVATSIIESFITGDMSRNQLHNTWVEYVGGSLKQQMVLDLTPRESYDRRSNLVHISLMKTMLIHNSNTYQLLRHLAPIFLQVAYSNPTLWPSGSDPTRIPLLNLFTSGPHELSHFALMDCTYSMASGLPQHIEYDTTIYSRPQSDSSYLHQWAHSSPTEFLLVLADINACRDKSPASRNCEEIERWLLDWQSQPCEHTFTESWMMIAWYAVQESWRLSLLVYLYLAVCDAPSDDPRIRSCVKQILQVVGTVKKPGPFNTQASLFCQYLMVGICARSEAHRRLARDKLASANETRFWLMRAPDIVPVLDHLWHGAGANGRPIKWSDYVHSREVALPVEL